MARMIPAILLLLAPWPAGDDWRGRHLLTPELTRCSEIATSDAALVRCRAAEISRQSQALDVDFAQKLSHVLDPRLRAMLPDDQRRWRQTTDAACASEGRRSPLGIARDQMCKLEAYTSRRFEIRIL